MPGREPDGRDEGDHKGRPYSVCGAIPCALPDGKTKTALVPPYYVRAIILNSYNQLPVCGVFPAGA
jgi:hypothetical protein